MDLIGYFEGDDCVDDVAKTMASIEESRGITPGIAEQAASKAILDVAHGTLAAKRLGKGQPGWLFTKQMAEQATHPEIAAYHALSLKKLAPTQDTVVEVCTGAGLDSYALSKQFSTVISFEADALVASIARGNLRRAGVTNLEIISEPWDSSHYHTNQLASFCLWADPSRRSKETRVRNAAQYMPPVESLLAVETESMGIKLGPADDVAQYRTAGYSIETIGFGRECREKILWKGADQPRVTLVDSKATWRQGDKAKWRKGEMEKRRNGEKAVSVVEPREGAFVVEPHAAVIASGFVEEYFSEIGAGVIDSRIAYGLCETQPALTALHGAYQIVGVDSGVSVKRIQQRINELKWNSRTEIKKRGWDKTTEWLWHKLTFPITDLAGVIIVARSENAHVTLYCMKCE